MDILERLKGYNPVDRTIAGSASIAADIHAAAKEIERLRAELKRLKAAAGHPKDDGPGG